MSQVWAHRGASAYSPENTIEAFRLAEQQGADGVELDVHLSADGEVVVIHDETVDRTSDGTGEVSQMTLESLRGLDFSNGLDGFRDVRIPTLAEVFEELRPGGMLINLELKTNLNFQPGIEARVVRLIRDLRMGERVLVSSFNHHSLKTVQQAAPEIQLGLLFSEILLMPWEYARSFGAVAIHPAYNFLRVNGAVELCHAAGVRIHPWTIDDPEHLRWAMGLGVDAVISNVPDRALAQRAGLEGAGAVRSAGL
ncbi:glycerophosphodiester phosphodiesterase [Enemella dayhoffiae]|uniref:Glycerophosphodiester phosphodiesterase n=1 Tax=Enemella dayhoffiae TaxID=2016507 RepID=A0A255GN87_9ACTN|nr:glycerophosphodiester phosphodiesterase [Enemella dayhoffiae]OYO17287.1 glycerophosphodiester phosphodiesterase [Enemella dayhoffiae]